MTIDRNEAPAKPRRRAWLIVGGALTAVLLLSGVVSFGMLFWVASSPWQSDSHTSAYESATGIDMSISTGEVHLTAGDGDELQVERDVTWKGPEPDAVDGLNFRGVVYAQAECSEEYMAWVFGDQCRFDYSIAMPSGADAEVRSSVADVNVDGLDGDLSLTGSVGDVNAQHLRTTGTSIATSTGSVTVAFDEVRGDVRIATSVGDVTVLVPDDGTTYDVRFDSSVGDEDLHIVTDPSAEADHVITVTTSVGDLDVRYTA